MPVTHGGVVMAVGVVGGGGGGARSEQSQSTRPPGSHRQACDRSRWAAA